MNIDPYILAFSAVTVLATIWMGFRSAKKSKTASDFFVAGRSVGVGMNASAISGEYLSAASFMGIAGMVMSSGYDALWYPVCYACGYLFLLLFIAGPLRRFGAYTIPDFAEGRFDSPVFRKIAVVFVLFIGFFYTMPQMKGAGTTLAYIFPGLPYWAGVVLVGAVITLNVALGGMKGITLVQAFQYWAKMFAISVPIFVLMAVYGHYGKQVGVNGTVDQSDAQLVRGLSPSEFVQTFPDLSLWNPKHWDTRFQMWKQKRKNTATGSGFPYDPTKLTNGMAPVRIRDLLNDFGNITLKPTAVSSDLLDRTIVLPVKIAYPHSERPAVIRDILYTNGLFLVVGPKGLTAVTTQFVSLGLPDRAPLPAKAPADATWLNPFGPLTTKAAKNAAAAIGKKAAASVAPSAQINDYDLIIAAERRGDIHLRQGLTVLQAVEAANKPTPIDPSVPQAKPVLPLQQRVVHAVRKMLADKRVQVSYRNANLKEVLGSASEWVGKPIFLERGNSSHTATFSVTNVFPDEAFSQLKTFLTKRNLVVVEGPTEFVVLNQATLDQIRNTATGAKNAGSTGIALRAGLTPDTRLTVVLDSPTVTQALGVYAELTGRQLLPNTNSLATRADDFLGGKLSKLKIISRPRVPDSGVREHGDGAFTAAEVKQAIEAHLRTNGLAVIPAGERGFRLVAAEVTRLTSNGTDQSLLTSAATTEKAWLAKHEKPLALLYTYSLIIAIVCGTAGLPHILVRFYTNPDGTAAKKTTMWVMILIGVFYVFPPVFGVIGRNLLPELYSGVGAKGTDKIVLELPRLLNEKYAPLGSILSGITCAGAFAAFMSTFSGLLVSMTGALAHDVYGRILRPKATPEQRMRMFKIGSVIIGAVAILLGMQVEQLQINFMVGQAFAIAAASYFPLLFMAVWWRKLTMKGAATGMLTGGTLALTGISLTSFSDLKWLNLADFWALHPLLRILCEQPAIWAVPLAIGLMIVVSKLTAREVPADSRMKMLVLHAPEELGLKQEYIQEHQPH